MKAIKSLRKIVAAIGLLVFVTLQAQEAKYIFYFIGDGMGMGQVVMAETYKREALGEKESLTMLQLPVHSLVSTYSASSPVTDSAAAGTALSTGSKTKNGMLGMNADTVAVTSIAKYLHDNGYGVAIMTNVAADDATPGAFYAHVPHRGQYFEIGCQAAQSGYELIAGSSLRGMIKGGKSTGLAEYIESKGVQIATSAEEVAESGNRRIILLPKTSKWGSNMGFNIDNVEGAMSVADLTTTAIQHLSRHTPDKFFMMVEGGNIDHAGHGNDGGTVTKEVYAFDKAIDVALEFYKAHPNETLIVVTADHETGGMSVGNKYVGYDANPEYFAVQTMSKDVFSQYCDDLAKSETTPQWEDMKQYLTDNFGFFTTIPVKQKEEEYLQAAFNSRFVKGEDNRQTTLYSNFSSFPVEVFKMLNDKAGAGWTTGGHSGNFVPLFAIGVGSELFMGQNDNTQVPGKILKAAGVEAK